MNRRSEVKLVSYNTKNVEICASAARISTTSGNAVEVFARAEINEANGKLIQKVLHSGHKSIIEHAVFTFALKDVSAFVEQFFIESRLASFTVKSRRYVDFSEMGYYIPPDLDGENRKQYCKYMDGLFSAYKFLVENGIPKEDARFLLPYSFNSNFYCTCNARELGHILHDIKYGRGQEISELQDLADQIIEQMKTVFPWIDFEVENMQEENNRTQFLSNSTKVEDFVTFIESGEAGKVSLVNSSSDPLRLLKLAYGLSGSFAKDSLDFSECLKLGRSRELEQLSYSFMISNITLSGITHIVRHRMQSIIIPSIQGIVHSKFIVPDTIKKDFRLFDIYKSALETSNKQVQQMDQNEQLKQYGYYYALSGNMMDIMTTMNARELMHFIKLRTCKRAQWEIRNISIAILKQLRMSFPELFSSFGPSCFVDGKCPEGNMTCGDMGEVIETFKYLS